MNALKLGLDKPAPKGTAGQGPAAAYDGDEPMTLSQVARRGLDPRLAQVTSIEREISANLTQVTAIERGHDGIAVREIGDTFHVDMADPRFKGCSWFVPSAEYVKPVPAKDTRPPGAGPARGLD
jgi:hypothetical protein